MKSSFVTGCGALYIVNFLLRSIGSFSSPGKGPGRPPGRAYMTLRSHLRLPSVFRATGRQDAPAGRSPISGTCQERSSPFRALKRGRSMALRDRARPGARSPQCHVESNQRFGANVSGFSPTLALSAKPAAPRGGKRGNWLSVWRASPNAGTRKSPAIHQ